MALKATDPACPISAFGLLFMPTARTLATCSSFGASEARDVGLFRFVTQIVDITAILPQRHTLIVMPAVIPIAHPARIANEERSDFIGDTKINDLTGGSMPRITNTPNSPLTDLILGTLQLFPATGILLASGLLLGKLSQLLSPLPFERTDTTACDDQGPLGIRRDSRKVDLSQVNRCMVLSGSSFSLWNLDADMQLKAVVPDQRTSSAVFRKLKRQNEGFATLAHRQNDASVLAAHSLSRPLDRIEAFLSPWILHLHLRVRLAKLACGLDSGKKSMDNHLDRLAMQRKLSLGCLLQFIATRPFGMSHSGLLVSLATEVPYTGRFHLSFFQASKQLWGGSQSIHAYGIHCCLLPFFCFLMCSCMAVKISPLRDRLFCFAISRICSNRWAGNRIVRGLISSFMQPF
jgi:hypothetical protein